MYNKLEYANLYFKIISSLSGKEELEKNKDLIIAIASIDSLEKFSNLKTKEKAVVKLAMGNYQIEKFDNFIDTIIKKSQLSGVIRDVGVLGGLGTGVTETRRKNIEEGITSPTEQFSGTGTDFLKSFLSYIPVVGGGIATYDIVNEIKKDDPSYTKIALSCLIIASDAFILYSVATRDPKGAPLGIGSKVLVGILGKIRNGLKITKTEQAILDKAGPSIIKFIDNMIPNIGRIIDKLPISSAQKTKLKTNLPEEFKVLRETINSKTKIGNLATNKIIDTMNSVYRSIPKGKQTIYITAGPQFIHIKGNLFLTPIGTNPNGTITGFNLVKLKSVSNQGVREIPGSASRAPDSIVARSEAALDMMTNPKWKDPGLNIDENMLSEGLKKIYRANKSSTNSTSSSAIKGLGVAGTGVAVGAGIAGGQAASSLSGAVVQGLTPGGTQGNLSGASDDAPGAY